MPRAKKALLHELSTADLKRLLAARERIDVLEVEQAKHDRELARIEQELERLQAVIDETGAGRAGKRGAKATRRKSGKKAAGRGAGTKSRRKAAKKRVAKKKAVKKKTAKKKTAKKRVGKKTKAGAAAAKKTVRRKTTKKKSTKKKSAKKKATKKKTTKKKTAKKKVAKRSRPAGRGRRTLEDVIVGVIKANRGPVSFQDLLRTIVSKKLFTTRSRNFENVLRRTLSTSDAVARQGRGIYGLA